MQGSRRDFLTGLGVVAGVSVAGCVNQDTDSRAGSSEEPNSAGESSRPRGGDHSAQETVPGVRPGVLVDESTTIEDGGFVAYDFSIDSETRFRYDIEVENNVQVDLLALSTNEFVNYERDMVPTLVDSANYIKDATGHFVIPEGPYYFVVDHSDRFGAEPPDGLGSTPANIDIKITY